MNYALRSSKNALQLNQINKIRGRVKQKQKNKESDNELDDYELNDFDEQIEINDPLTDNSTSDETSKSSLNLNQSNLDIAYIDLFGDNEIINNDFSSQNMVNLNDEINTSYVEKQNSLNETQIDGQFNEIVDDVTIDNNDLIRQDDGK